MIEQPAEKPAKKPDKIPFDQKICVTVEEAALYMSVSRPTMLQFTHMNGFPCFREGRKILIPRQGLIDWAERRGMQEGATQCN